MTLSKDAVVATGGIGTGIFMALEGEQTLGREESRAAQLLDLRDYCKLHIVCHYLQRLLGPEFPVFPIGRVGEDAAGAGLVSEMQEVGLDTTFVDSSPKPTLFSVCYLYPGGDGGNLTTSVSASSDVSAEDVLRARPVFERYEGAGVALALPEVSLEARTQLLRLATEHRFLRVATLLPGEAAVAGTQELLSMVDLLSLNIDEAAALVPGLPVDGPPEQTVGALVERMQADRPNLQLVVTAGGRGSWSWDGVRLVHAPALPAEVVGTAGAGDAHLAAVVVGLVGGARLDDANRFAALVSGLKVTSGHTINPDIDRAHVATAAAARDYDLSPEVLELLRPVAGGAPHA